MTTASQQKDVYQTSRILYIIEAALECFIATAVAGTYLDCIAERIGMSQGASGVLSAFVSLGCGFQIFAVFLANKKPVKVWVTALHIISQILFGLLYFIPVFNFSSTFKIICLFVLMISAEAMHNLINSPKINWYMSLVDNHKRGTFTATKEMVSLIGNILFGFALGSILDAFTATETVDGVQVPLVSNTGFIIVGCMIFGLMTLHTLTLIFSKEKPDNSPKVSTIENLKSLVKNKPFWKVVAVQAIWSFAYYTTIAFMGTYFNRVLLPGQKSYFVLITSVASVARILFSLPMGKIADKYSFKTMLNVCFAIAMGAFATGVFIAPGGTKVLMFAFYILIYVAMAGINSSTINLVYDYVDTDKRMSALAFSKSIAGVCGFLPSVILAPVLNLFGESGKEIFGINVYGQQLFPLISLIIVTGLIVFLNIAFRKMKRVDLDDTSIETASNDEKINQGE